MSPWCRWLSAFAERMMVAPTSTTIPQLPSRGIAMPVAMELARIIISEINSEQVIYLKEIDGDRTFPI